MTAFGREGGSESQRAHAVPGQLTPACLEDQQTPGQLAIRGETVVYTLRRIVDGAERIELWTVPFGGGPARALTSGPFRDSCPRFDPSGARVAFLRSGADTENDAAAQVCLVDVTGGTPRTVTDFPRGVVDLAWVPDGDALIVLAEDSDADRSDAGGSECAAAGAPRVIRAAGAPAGAAPTAIRLTAVDWRADGEVDGGLRLYPRHLHRVPLDGGNGRGGFDARRLTRGEWSAARPRVGSDGGVYFLADRSATADLRPAPQVHTIAPRGQGGESDDVVARQVTALPGGVARFHLAGSGLRVLGYPSADRPDDEPPTWFEMNGDAAVPLGAGSRAAAHRGDAPGSVVRCWTGLLGDETDLHEWQLELDDCADVTTVSDAGSTVPVDLVTGETCGVDDCVAGATAADGHRRVAVLSFGAAAAWAPDVYALDGDGPRRLTTHGDWLAGRACPGSETLTVDGPAGPITTFVLHPPNGTDCKGTILDIHGGPTGQWACVPPVEAVLLAAAGYRVAMPNIRGSLDRGPAWVAALRGAWGNVDVADALAVCDGLVRRGLVAPGRLGVMGLSYGGFLTQYLVGITDRFFAAIAENGVANQISAWAGSALGPAYNVSAGLADPLTDDGARALWDCSPLKNAAAIHTPLLLLQGGDDRTCPASDNEQLFVALRVLGRPVEYVIYPEESHLMQATARFDRRIDRHQRVIAWFDSHLTIEENA